MKKTLITAIALCMLAVSLSGCGGAKTQTASDTTSAQESTASETTKTTSQESSTQVTEEEAVEEAKNAIGIYDLDSYFTDQDADTYKKELEAKAAERGITDIELNDELHIVHAVYTNEDSGFKVTYDSPEGDTENGTYDYEKLD